MNVETASQVHWYRILFTAAALLLSLQWSSVAADYNMKLRISSFNNPNNTDASGVCCNETEGMSNCSIPCDVKAYVCIRSSGSTLPSARGECPIFSINTPLTASGTYHIPLPWLGGFQLLYFIEENQSDRNLVDLFHIEFTGTAAQPNETVSVEMISSTGSVGSAELTLSLGIQCDPGFHGPSCDCQNTNDSTGHFTCTIDGGMECLEGYQNPDTNCTECSTSKQCSDVGGFCKQPGDCVCRNGYMGQDCSLLDTTDVSFPAFPASFSSATISPSMMVLSAEPISTQVTVSSSQSSQPSVPPVLSLFSSSITPLTTSAPIPTTIEMTSSAFSSVPLSSFTYPPATSNVPMSSSTGDVLFPSSLFFTSSPFVSQPMTTMTSGQLQTTTQPLPTTTQQPSSTISDQPQTTATIQQPQSTTELTTTELSPTPTTELSPTTIESPPPTTELSPTTIGSPPPTTELSPTTIGSPPPTTELTTTELSPTPTTELSPTTIESPPPTTELSPTTTELSPTTIGSPPPTTELPPTTTELSLPTTTELPPTTIESPPPTTELPPTTTELSPTTTELSPTTNDPTTTMQQTIFSTLQPQTDTITGPTRSPAPPVPTTSTTGSTEPPTASVPSSGNEAAIAGAVAVIIAVVVLVLITVLCAYCVMKRRRNKNQPSTVFLEEVYNAPVTFINPEHEGVPPRSPQLFILANKSVSGGDQQYGIPLDESHKPSFPGVDYRQHVPYAETGPSSDRAQSPADESTRVYHFQDAETTIIANPHSQPLDSPLPLAVPIAKPRNINKRNGGLKVDYKDNPAGNAYPSDQYTEKPLSTSAQSSTQSRPETDQSLRNPTPPQAPPRTSRKPISNLRGSGREQELHRAAAGAARPKNDSHGMATGLRDRKEAEEGDRMKKRVNDYLQAAQEEGEKRQSSMREILFTDIDLDMTTQTEL